LISFLRSIITHGNNDLSLSLELIEILEVSRARFVISFQGTRLVEHRRDGPADLIPVEKKQPNSDFRAKDLTG
jgi:hypothetical protein